MKQIAIFVFLLLAAATLRAQEHDFDYLLGDWEFSADSIDYGKYGGFWSAIPLETGQILDQYRVTDGHGKTWSSTISLRAYNAAKKEWELVSTNKNNGVRDFGVAHREGNEMHIEQTFGASSEHPSVWHIRYYNIEADRFLWDGECSRDGGKTYKRCLHIDAHRIGPPRLLGQLAPTIKPK